MKRISWALLLLLLFTLPVFTIAAPSPAPSIDAQTIILNDFSEDHLHSVAAAYVANRNTGKFHYAGCRSVRQMNPGNKVYYDSRQAAANAGYVACKICRP